MSKKNGMRPKISVVIPAFNRGHIIKEALDSVLHQTYNYWECLVIDDGSNDNTEEVIKSYSRRDARIKFFKRPGERAKGASTCRNIGIEKSTGEYIQFLDSDDWLENNKFEIQIKKLRSASENAIATCKWGSARISAKEAKVYHGSPTYFSTRRPIDLIETFGKRLAYFPPHVYLVPKSVLLESGKWNEDLNNTVNDDGEFFSRVILASSEIIYCKDTYVLYRKGAGGRITGSNKQEEGRLGYIKSLKLVDENIRKSTGTSTNHIYIEQRKAELYYKLKKENPKLIEENKTFFAGKSSPQKYYFLRLISGLKNKISKRAEKIYLSSAES